MNDHSPLLVALSFCLFSVAASPIVSAQYDPSPDRVSFVVPLATSGGPARFASFDVTHEGSERVLTGCVSELAGACNRTTRRVLSSAQSARYEALWQALSGPRSCSMLAPGPSDAQLVIQTPAGTLRSVFVSTVPSRRSAHEARISPQPSPDCECVPRLGFWLASLLRA